MLLTDFKSVIKSLDIDILDEIASEFVRDTPEKQKQFPILDQIKEYWFEESEEKLGNAKAIQLLEEIDFQAIADYFEEKYQDIVDEELEQKATVSEGWASGAYYVDKETGAVEERF